MSDFIEGVFHFAVFCLMMYCWGVAVFRDAGADRIGYLLLDICAPPFAILRGFYLAFVQ